MDGNGRWARQRHLPRIEGHRQGANAVRKAIESAGKLGIPYLTLYAFSTENWNRPRDEVDGLMKMLQQFLSKERKTLIKHQIRLRAIGRIRELPEEAYNALKACMEATAHFNKGTLVLALNYSSRTEIQDAVQRIFRERAEGAISADMPIDWECIKSHLDTSDIPDPDLIIRTSGECRLSNFLLLQAAYAELIFTPVLWPDFDHDTFQKALDEYARRERRYGLTSEQLQELP